MENKRGSSGDSPSLDSSSRDSPSHHSPSGDSASSLDLPRRKRPAHGVRIDGDRAAIVYVTVCTKDRVPWLACEAVHDLLRMAWKEAAAWWVGKYVVMPDHIRLFAGYAGQEIGLDNWVRYWKSLFRKRHGINDHRWQSGYWDRRLRTSESYEEKWQYVRHNPVRHGLVYKPEEWPFQGEIHVLPWG